MFESLKLKKQGPFYIFFLRLGIMLIPGGILVLIFRQVTSLKYMILSSSPIFYFYKVLMYSSKGLLTLLGFNPTIIYSNQIYYYPVFALQIGQGGLVFLGISCLGILLMAPFAALIIAYPGRARTKLWFIAVGCLVIQILNIIRISLLTVLLSYYGIPVDKGVNIFGITTASHHDVFNFIIFIFIFLMFILWVRKFSKTSYKNRITAAPTN